MPTDAPLTSAEEAGDYLEAATTVAPSLLHSPATAYTVATGSNGDNIEQNAQSTANSQHLSAVGNVAKKQEGGFFGMIDSLGHDVGHVAVDVGHGLNNILNAPMSLAQHSFRYLVATEQKHGWGAALGESLGMLAGAAVVGGLTGGFGDLGLEALGAGEGSEFSLSDAASSLAKNLLGVGKGAKAARAGFFTGGQLGGWATGQVAYHDLWDKTASSKWVDEHGHQVSFGRVIAGMMGLRSGGYRTAVSGTLDAIFDIANSNLPFAQQIGAAHGLEGATGVFSKFGGYAMTTDHIDQMIEHPAVYRPFHTAAQWIADHSSGEIGQMFPELNAAGKLPQEARFAVGPDGTLEPIKYINGRVVSTPANFAVGTDGTVTDLDAQKYADGFISELGQAKTKDEVFEVLRRYNHIAELLNGSRAPTMSLFRYPLARLRQAAEEAESRWTLPNLDEAIQGGKGSFRRVPMLDEHGNQIGTQLVGHKVPFKGARRALAPILSSVSPATWARRLHHQPGMMLDPKTFLPYNRDVDLVTNRLPSELMDYLTVTQGRKYAAHFGDVWLHSDPAARSVLNANGQIAALFGMIGHRLDIGKDADLAVFNDPETRQYLLNTMNTLMGHFNPDTAGRYGAYRSGKALQPIVDANGRRQGAGVLLSQHGRATLMNLTEMRKMAGELRAGKDLYGAYDDWMYRHATQPLFKRWVLISGGYMSRIAAAEDIPNTLRHGLSNMVAGAVAHVQAHYGWELEYGKGELNHIQQAVYDLIGHIPLSQEKVDAATEMYLMGNGNGLSLSTMAGHGQGGVNDTVTSTENGMRSLAARGKQTRFGREYAIYGPDSRYHLMQWRVWLNQIRRDPMSSAAARAMQDAYDRGADLQTATHEAEDAFRVQLNKLTPDVRARYLASQYLRDGDPEDWTPEDSWVHHGVQNMIAATHTPTDVPEAGPHMGVLSAAGGRTRIPTPRYLKQIEETRRPAGVPGREVLEDGEGTPAALATKAFKFMNGFVNLTSRHSEFFNEYLKQRRVVMAEVEKGLLSHDQGMTVAYARASKEATRWIHNLHDRTMWTETMRNWSPFWFAKEQAYRRMGRLLASDPAAFREYELMIMGAHNLTNKLQDPESNPYVVLPGEGFLTDSILTPLAHLGLPIGQINPVELGGDFSSTSVVFPTSNLATEGQGFWGLGPDFGPVAVVPAKLMYGAISAEARHYTSFAKPIGMVQNLTQGVFGQQAINETLLNDILPNTALQRTVEALQANDNTFDTAMMLTIQTMDYDQNVAMQKWIDGGRKGPAPTIVPPLNASAQEKQAFLSRVKNMTQMNLIARALMSIATPVTLEMAYRDYGLPQELQTDIQKAGSVSAGMTAFLRRNPNATPYTVSESTHPGDLASLPDSAQAMNWIDQNMALVQKYPEAAIWLMPQALTTDAYSQTAYNEQVADNLRVKDTPQQFLDALYTAAGDQTYYAAYAEHKAALQAAGNNQSALDAEYNKWDNYVKQLSIQQPTWYENTSLFSPTKQVEAQQTLTQLEQLIGSGKVPDSTQVQLVSQLIQNYKVASAAYASANESYDYTSAVSKVREQWAAYLAQMKSEYPQLSPIISSVFSGLLYFNPGS